MRTAFRSSVARLHAFGGRALVDADRLGDLVPHGEERVQRRHWILKDHGDPLTRIRRMSASTL